MKSSDWRPLPGSDRRLASGVWICQVTLQPRGHVYFPLWLKCEIRQRRRFSDPPWTLSIRRLRVAPGSSSLVFSGAYRCALPLDEWRASDLDWFEPIEELKPLRRFRCSDCGVIDVTVWDKSGVQHWRRGAEGEAYGVICGEWQVIVPAKPE
jgi:hypothetical protein